MIYEFQSKRGDVIEVDMPIGSAPVGKRVRRNGRVYTRLATGGRMVPIVKEDRHFVAHSLPYNYKYHIGKFDSKGRCLFDSWREVRECEARARHGGDVLSYD